MAESYLLSEHLPIKKVALYQPPLEEIVKVLQDELQQNFDEASVCETNCPDLSLPPYNISSPGLGGQCSLIDIGSSSYLTPIAQRDKVYDIKNITKVIGIDPACLIGAGLGPWPCVGVNCEMIANLTIAAEKINNQTHGAHIVKDKCQLDTLPAAETRCAILVNLFCSKGQPSKVLKVHCKSRRGEEDIITCMRKAINKYYKGKLIGLGGTFILTGSPGKQHIMPDFSSIPLNTPELVQNWIQFYNHGPPLVAVGTLVSNDPGLDLKVQHFHGLNIHGEGGHFYTDTQPSTAEYIGYFALAKVLYKVDQPS